MTTQEILAILAATPGAIGLIQDLARLFAGNPQQQGEADAAYIARVGALIDQNTAKIVAQDADIQKD